ncbi:KUP/HAK/KT family potassium transporter [Streptococcus equi]|uniref:KUP/HAK/KT family potassium transporter n=1 Tax=Streptococcus equi TaxID=1336 RepID=UPI0013F63E97|nr:KUP/HAK/KT family potassium transporter [Streptococcus equi]HEK9998554.1 KUP/HAK/KT family potassium transporter [Streptococcus equi subsp. zooepidemicus]
MSDAHHDAFDKATKAGFIIALGIVYGDIGTSPLYTMQSLVDNQGGLSQVSEAFILGSVSLIIWTLTLVTTIKYVLIALKADNHHEGGIFSLFTLVRRMSRWLIIPAMLGGATLLSDGALTPAVTVTSAIEGLKAVPELSSIYQNQTNVILTTLLILMVLFGLQRFGTGVIGKLFGPVMLVWFSVLGISGLLNSLQHLEILKAINPYYALHLLVSPENHRGIFILGSIFLATTGAEALYSDLGHVGRGNIYASWPFVKVCIILSYCGQAAWILAHKDSGIALNPFFASVPEGLRVYLVILATLAAIIASQALISGSFTLVSEAMRLKIFPLFKITYPGANLGQLYIPVINWSLFAVTSCTVLYFRTSAHMEAAYGLAITITMLMTTILLAYYLIKEGVKPLLASLLMAFFAFIEFIFFLASAVKFMHGGYVVVVLALAIVFVMVIWHAGTMIVAKYVKSLSLNDYKHQIKLLRDDLRFDLYQTNVVYLTNRMKKDLIDRSILYSILDKRPKRAQVYWFVNVRVTDEPYTATYKVDMLETDYIVCVELYLGFRMPQTVPRYLRTIVQDLMESGRLPKQAQDYTITPGREVGDFRFVIIEERVSHARQLSTLERFVMQTKASIKHVTASPMRWFGLQYSEATVEVVPLLLSDVLKLPIKEIKACTKDEKA